jgi:hypothetical protein
MIRINLLPVKKSKRGRRRRELTLGPELGAT